MAYNSQRVASLVLSDSRVSLEYARRLLCDERLSAVEDLDLLDAPVEHHFQVITDLVNSLLDTAVCLVTLVTDDRQFFVSSTGLKEPWAQRRQTPLTHSFCQYVVIGNEPFIVSDARSHPLVCENLAIDDLGVAAYLGVPLVHDDQVLGSFCVIDGERREWSSSDLETLQKMATLVVSELVARKAAARKQFELESRLRQSQKMEALGQLTNGFSHDVNNILWAIQICTDLLKKEANDTGPTLDYTNQIYDAVESARDVVGRLLNWVRPGDFAAADVSLTQIVSESLPLLRTSISSAEILFEATDEGLIFADKNQVHQILLNLCSNAAEAMGNGGEISISVGTRQIASDEATKLGIEPDAYVELAVSDKGHGIAAGILHRIHDPYFTTKQAREGTGLGLWTVFGIVRRHDAQIHVQSVPNVGTTFKILFRETVGNSENAENRQLPSNQAPTATRVLVVDTDATDTPLAPMFKSLGFAVVSFEKSSDALEYFLQNPNQVDVLVTERAMPILSGEQLIQRCKLVRPSLPYVLCGDIDQGPDEMEADAYFVRPFDGETLGRAVESLTRERNLVGSD